MIGRGGENGTGFPYAGICVVKINKFHEKKLSGIENLLKAIDTVGKSCYHSIVKQPETLPERFPAKPVRERSTEYDVTIKDIARLSGVSVSTVSRVLNNRPDVSDENRRRVRAIIESSNYIPNNSARDLVRTKSDAIGLVVRGRSNPFYTDIIRAIEQGITERGYTMVMQQIGTSDDEVKRAAVMEREKRLRGLILLGGRSDYTPAEVALLNVPFVCCSYSNHYGTLRDEMYSSVSIEDEEEAYRAVMELYRRGHRRIAALGRRFHGAVRHRRQYGHRRDARAARDGPPHPGGLLRDRHRRADRLGIHPPRARHALPADGGDGAVQRGDPARPRGGVRDAASRDAADSAARGRVHAQTLIFVVFPARTGRENKF